MTSKLYRKPFRFDMLMERNHELPAADLRTSVTENISLIISSSYGEHRYDPDFGCEIWERDFELIANPLVWQEEVNSSIIKSISRYEQRLSGITVDTTLTEVPYMHPATGIRSIKKKISVHVRGSFKATGAQFDSIYTLYLSPVSLD